MTEHTNTLDGLNKTTVEIKESAPRRLATSTCSAILGRVTKHTQFVMPSTQYGMGLIITDANKIVFRDDSLSHEQRRAIAQEVNSHLPQHLPQNKENSHTKG